MYQYGTGTGILVLYIPTRLTEHPDFTDRGRHEHDSPTESPTEARHGLDNGHKALCPLSVELIRPAWIVPVPLGDDENNPSPGALTVPGAPAGPAAPRNARKPLQAHRHLALLSYNQKYYRVIISYTVVARGRRARAIRRPRAGRARPPAARRRMATVYNET